MGFKLNNTSKLTEDFKKKIKSHGIITKPCGERADFEFRDKAEKYNSTNYLDKTNKNKDI